MWEETFQGYQWKYWRLEAAICGYDVFFLGAKPQRVKWTGSSPWRLQEKVAFVKVWLCTCTQSSVLIILYAFLITSFSLEICFASEMLRHMLNMILLKLLILFSPFHWFLLNTKEIYQIVWEPKSMAQDRANNVCLKNTCFTVKEDIRALIQMSCSYYFAKYGNWNGRAREKWKYCRSRINLVWKFSS